jgi:hypothetical protein
MDEWRLVDVQLDGSELDARGVFQWAGCERSCDLGSLLLMLLLCRPRGRKGMARKGGDVEPRRRGERSRNTGE